MAYEFSLVIPAYNEVKNLPYILNEYAKEKKNIKFQLVVVNNGSSDSTEEYLKKIKKIKRYNFVRVVKIKKNIGYGYGIYQGLINTDTPVVGWTHADLQTPTKDPFRAYSIYKKLEARGIKAFVKGHRKKRSFFAKIISQGLQFYSTIILLKLFDDINGQPKIFNKDLLNKCNKPPLGFSFDTYVQYVALRNGYKVKSFKVDFVDRKHGVSSWANSLVSLFSTIKSFLKDIWHIRTQKID